MSGMSKVVAITGITASGKSQLAIEICKQSGGEIINADSVQVYKEFDIGSSKPNSLQIGEVPHHLFSFLSPETRYNAWDFAQSARECICEIEGRGKLPVLVGGTGLYLQSFLYGFADHEKIDSEIKNQIDEKEAEAEKLFSTKEEIAQYLYNWLASINKEAIQMIHSHDSVRVKRALEIQLAFGSSFKEKKLIHKDLQARFKTLVVCLLPDRVWLYQRINQRVEQMIEDGLLDEVENLLSKYDKNSKPFSSIGYKEAVEHIEGKITKDEMIDSIQQATRRFAKRQYTWWNNQPKKLNWKELGEESFFATVETPNPLKMQDKILETKERFFWEKGKTQDSNVGIFRIK
jgi:tRNA dimethylallyltransferase